MQVSNDIRLYKAFPDEENVEGYLPIDGSIVRTADVIYLEINTPRGYGVAQIRRNGEEIRPFPSFVDGRYKIIVNDCNDTYTVVLGRIPGVQIIISQDDALTHQAIFQNQ